MRGRTAILPAGVAALGVLLLLLGVPRLVAGAVEGPFDVTVRALASPVPPSSARIDLALASRKSALLWFDNGKTRADIGALSYARWRQLPAGDAARARYLDDSIAADRAAVTRAPAQPFVWARLLRTMIERDGYGADVSAYLVMAYRTAPAEPRLVLPRLDVALTLWPRLDAAARRATQQQIVLAMQWFPAELVATTRRRFALAVVRQALEPHPQLRARFNILYLSQRG